MEKRSNTFVPNKKIEKEKPAEVTIKQFETAMQPDELGRIGIIIFGLGDNGEVYIWHAQERKWREK